MAVKQQPQQMQMGQAQLPAGLNYLNTIDQVIVRQKKELLEIMTGFETCNRYVVTNNQNQEIFFVQEESSLFERCFCPQVRGFVLHMTDNNSQEVMTITREFRCCTGCCWCADGCCNMELVVESPPGRVVGKIRTSNSKWKPHMKIMDGNDTHMFTIWGPCCPCQAICCPADVEFPITDPSLQHSVGMIAKQWRGCCVETFTDADRFSLTFPRDMAMETKLTLLGSLFLVEYLVFERSKNNNNS